MFFKKKIKVHFSLKDGIDEQKPLITNVSLDVIPALGDIIYFDDTAYYEVTKVYHDLTTKNQIIWVLVEPTKTIL